MRKIICSILLVMWSLAIYSQADVLVNVDIGDSIPAIYLQDIADRSESEVNLRELSKGKLVVLDFWATWCGSCWAAMPKLDSIATEYAGDIEIITVTTQPKELVIGFLEKRKERGLYVHRMPKLFGDKELAVLFPHRFIPHYVWLKDGKVIAFTEEVTREAVDKALLNGEVSLRTKMDQVNESFNIREELLLYFLQKNRHLNLKEVINYSFLTGYIDRLGTKSGYAANYIDSLNKMKFTAVNMSLENMYRVAYGKRKTYINESAVEVNTESAYFATKVLKGMWFLDWLKDYGVSYEAMVSLNEDIYRKMVSDLDIAFPQFKAGVVKARDTCIVLVETESKPEIAWRMHDGAKTSYNVNEDGIFVKNGTIQGFLTLLESSVFIGSKYPLVDGINYEEKISVEMKGGLRSLEELNLALVPYGLRLEKKEADYDKLVIKDR